MPPNPSVRHCFFWDEVEHDRPEDGGGTPGGSADRFMRMCEQGGPPQAGAGGGGG
eukprot:gene4485-19096_t